MAAVGLAVLGGYAAAAYLGYLVVYALWTIRLDPLAAVVVLACAISLSGYVSYRFGPARLLAAFPTSRLPRRRPRPSTVGSTVSSNGWTSTARRCTSHEWAFRTRWR